MYILFELPFYVEKNPNIVAYYVSLIQIFAEQVSLKKTFAHSFDVDRSDFWRAGSQHTILPFKLLNRQKEIYEERY